MSFTVDTDRGSFRVSHLERMASRKQVFCAVDQLEISRMGAWDFFSSHASHAFARPYGDGHGTNEFSIKLDRDARVFQTRNLSMQVSLNYCSHLRIRKTKSYQNSEFPANPACEAKYPNQTP